MITTALQLSPRPFGELIGRDAEVAAISSWLRAPDGSILTLVGPAGVGKTRLASAVALAVVDDFADGVVSVDLTAVFDPQQVLPAILAALGLSDRSYPVEQLGSYLADRSMLLVLDNFEQVLAAGPALNAALASAPRVRVIVTSQAALHVRGEREFTVAPLPVPEPQRPSSADQPPLEDIAEVPSVRLFVQRARAVRPSFELTPQNASAVAGICRYLDGIPLAIELAAARSNVLSPEALLGRLSGSLRLLSGGPRDVSDRHRALHAAIDWSYGLLTSSEALLLERLSVFNGTFSLAAAEAVAGNAPIVFSPSKYLAGMPELPPDDGLLEGSEVFDLLENLVDHSLVQYAASSGDEPRFRLFTTIRQYASDRLAARNDTERTRRRHAAWYHVLAESAWDANGVPKLERLWLESLDADYENIRAALDYLSSTEPATASLFASSLLWYFYIRGRRLEGIRAIERIRLAYDPACISDEARARMGYAYGNLIALFPETRDAGFEELERVLHDLLRLGNEWGAGYTYVALGVLNEDMGRYDEASALIELGRPLLEAVGDEPTMANVDYHLAVSAFGMGRIDEATRLARSVVERRPDDAGLNIAYALHLLSIIALSEGDTAEAARSTASALAFSLDHGVVATATELIDTTATIAAHAQDFDTAAILFGAADRANRETGNPITVPERTLYDAARAAAEEALGPVRFRRLYDRGKACSLQMAWDMTQRTLDAYVAPTDSPAPPSGAAAGTRYQLTPRELEVLSLVAQGKSDREIADRLFISHGTARTHVRNILAKLDTPSRTGATSIALREHLVDLESTPGQ